MCGNTENENSYGNTYKVLNAPWHDGQLPNSWCLLLENLRANPNEPIALNIRK